MAGLPFSEWLADPTLATKENVDILIKAAKVQNPLNTEQTILKWMLNDCLVKDVLAGQIDVLKPEFSRLFGLNTISLQQKRIDSLRELDFTPSTLATKIREIAGKVEDLGFKIKLIWNVPHFGDIQVIAKWSACSGVAPSYPMWYNPNFGFITYKCKEEDCLCRYAHTNTWLFHDWAFQGLAGAGKSHRSYATRQDLNNIPKTICEYHTTILDKVVDDLTCEINELSAALAKINSLKIKRGRPSPRD